MVYFNPQRDGSYTNDDESVDIENESASGNRFEEYEWCGQKRIRATTLLEGGFRGMQYFEGLFFYCLANQTFIIIHQKTI